MSIFFGSREGRPKLVCRPKNIDAVRELIKRDYSPVTYRGIEASLGISSYNIHSMGLRGSKKRLMRTKCMF